MRHYNKERERHYEALHTARAAFVSANVLSATEILGGATLGLELPTAPPPASASASAKDAKGGAAAAAAAPPEKDAAAAELAKATMPLGGGGASLTLA